MKLSPLQVARYQYSPKLPGMLRNGISDICVCSGGATESVADQEKIKALPAHSFRENGAMTIMAPFRKGGENGET